MTPAQALTLVSVTALVLLVLMLTGWAWSWRRRTPRPSAHTGYVTGQDVLTRVETIDLALSVTTDEAQRDVLLDMRIRAVSS